MLQHMSFLTALKFDRGQIEKMDGQPFRVTALGGNNFGIVWIHKIDEVIGNIEAGRHCYVCQQENQTVMVRVGVDQGGKKYLKAHIDPDDGDPKVLMALPLKWCGNGPATPGLSNSNRT